MREIADVDSRQKAVHEGWDRYSPSGTSFSREELVVVNGDPTFAVTQTPTSNTYQELGFDDDSDAIGSLCVSVAPS